MPTLAPSTSRTSAHSARHFLPDAFDLLASAGILSFTVQNPPSSVRHFFQPIKSPSGVIEVIAKAVEALLAPDRSARDRSAPYRLAPDRSAPYRLAPDRLAPYRLAPDRSAPDRLAPDRLARDRLAPYRSAPDRSAPYRLAPDRLARDRLAPDRLARDRSARDRSAREPSLSPSIHFLCLAIISPSSSIVIFIILPLPFLGLQTRSSQATP